MTTQLQHEHSKRKHSNYAASSSHRWMNCPASVRLSKTAPPERPNPYAIEGTNAHECMEFIVRRFGNIRTAEKEALKKWPADMVQHAINSAKIVFKLRPSPEAKLLIETRVILKHIGPGLFGTLDYAWVDLWGLLVIIDFKYGAGVPVLPFDDETNEENSQLMYYGSGIAAKYDYEFSAVKLAIIQPRVWREDEDPLTEHTTTIKKLREFEKKVKLAVAAAKVPDCQPIAPPEGAADNWCRWCPAASYCPAVSQMQMSNAGIAFSVDSGIDEAKIPEVQALTPATLPKVLHACDLLETWIKKVRVHAFGLACDGAKIEGRKLVEKRSTRYWLPLAEKKAKKLYGDDAFKTEMLSPAQFEKALGKESKSFTKKYTDNKSSGHSLVKSSDRREEVLSTVAFQVDEDETLD